MSETEGEPTHSRFTGYQLTTWVVLGLAVVLIAGLFGIRLEHQPETTRDYPPRAIIPDAEPVLLEAPEINDEYLPCSDCHDSTRPVNREVRVLEDEHDVMEFAHGNLWCLHCHDSTGPQSLQLADETRIDMKDSWKLCTQCHAKKLPDWRAGVHGKRTGHWRGEKDYRTCVVCHDPHSPAFKPLEPKPRPRRPEEITLRADSGGPAGGDSHGES